MIVHMGCMAQRKPLCPAGILNISELTWLGSKLALAGEGADICGSRGFCEVLWLPDVGEIAERTLTECLLCVWPLNN